MPQVLNFDLVSYDTVTITKGEHDYVLRDDVPVERIAPIVAFMARMSQWQVSTQTGISTEEDVIAVADMFTELNADLIHLVGEIFRHTFPGMGDEEIGTLFDFQQRLGIVQLFFSLAGNRYSAQANAGSPNSPAQKKPNSVRRRG